MVFQIYGTMVINGFGKRANFSDFKNSPTDWDFSRHLQQLSPGLKPVFAKFRWSSVVPSPLNGMVGGNHWKRWISDDVLGQATIGNDGFQWLSTIALVRRWNGEVPTLKSNHICSTLYILCSSLYRQKPWASAKKQTH